VNAPAKKPTAAKPADDNPNLAIWNAVCRTDPRHTKRVNQRGGFTAIDAQYQIMEATRQFGPIGVGWGYDAGAPIFQNTMVVVPVTIWHGKRGNSFGPIYGCAEMFGKYPDRDAPKKAETDGITKGLSQLGFNADVFLGLFDDNKYVEQMRQEFGDGPANDLNGNGKIEGITKIKDRLRRLLEEGDRAENLEAFNELIHGKRDDLQKIKDAKHTWWTGDGADFEGFASWITRRRSELSEDGAVVTELIRSMKQCDTALSLTNWMAANEEVIGSLDGAESRRFELAYNLHESAIQTMDRATGGA
jgi:hypothetical protein